MRVQLAPDEATLRRLTFTDAPLIALLDGEDPPSADATGIAAALAAMPESIVRVVWAADAPAAEAITRLLDRRGTYVRRAQGRHRPAARPRALAAQVPERAPARDDLRGLEGRRAVCCAEPAGCAIARPMRSSVRSAAFVVSVALFLVACPSAPTRVCTPGASSACVGPGGCMGGQVCNADGTALGTCDCGGPVDAGPVDAGAPSDVPPALDVPAPPGDTGAVDAPGDAAATACDPITQGGCGLGERCVWRILMDTPESIGELACVADGTVAEGDPCTQGAPGVATGFDDCQAGLVCINGACAAICDFGDASSCGPTGYCTRYAGLFQNGEDDPVAGACNASCDPVTQLRADGTSCGASQGCYMLLSPASTLFVCAGAGSIAVGSTIAGTLYANVCVPGATPSRRADGTNYCTAHCRPIETHSGAPAGAAGMAPYSCPERGASSPPHECLFGAFFSGMDPPDPRLNTLGVCFDRTGHLYDSNGDMTPDAPWPSCTTLANTDANGDGVADHRYFGCAPALLP